VGSIIGTGVFFKAAPMAQLVGSPGLVMLAWLVAGFMSLCGALTYAELGAMMPQAGGEYIYTREGYGPLAGFLSGWMRFVVASAGIGALGVGFATFLSAIWPMGGAWISAKYELLGRPMLWQLGPRELVASLVLLGFGVVNTLGVVVGGHVQMALTIIKCAGIVLVVVGAFFFSGGAPPDPAPAAAAPATLGAFGAAVLSALWACNGWAFMPMAAGEVSDPGRNVPRGLIYGVLITLTLYALANLAYFYALPFSEVLTANSTRYREALPVASKTAQTFLGDAGPRIISIVFLFSAAGAINGTVLAKARVPFAMARDGLFAAPLARVSAGSRVPAVSIMAVSVWASVLALSGTFDQLTDMTIFAEWIFYGLAGSTVFVLRRKLPDAPRPYRVLGYPVIPAVFLLLAAWLVINSVVAKPVESCAGLLLIVLGLPVYFYYSRKPPARPGKAAA
jgi:APA family basic amino acid/polyamine antiporter